MKIADSVQYAGIYHKLHSHLIIIFIGSTSSRNTCRAREINLLKPNQRCVVKVKISDISTEYQFRECIFPLCILRDHVQYFS